jgi:hypothetical protein
VSALAHYFEEEGIPSVAIVLVREHAEKIRPPRALWVPFELGRPLGAPDEPEFQKRVLRDALALLDSRDGPALLADFPDDAPGAQSDDMTGWVCPVSFAAPPPADEGPVTGMLGEIAELAPWYQFSLDRRKRTMVGVSGLEIDDAARFVAAFLDGIPDDNPMPDRAIAFAFKDAFTDILAYYSEAGTAQPGNRSSRDVLTWFWRQTEAGKLLIEVREKARASDNADLRIFAERTMLPNRMKDG